MTEKITIGDINYGGKYLSDSFWLPHSCDEWVIGNIEAAKKFRDNLSEVIAAVESELQAKEIK